MYVFTVAGVYRTLAALADAHDEAFLITRVADSSDFSPTDLQFAVERLLGLILLKSVL